MQTELERIETEAAEIDEELGILSRAGDTSSRTYTELLESKAALRKRLSEIRGRP